MGKYRRGIRNFNTLFGDTETVVEKKKGRDADIIAERNVVMYHRYYYYARIHKLPYVEMIYEAMRKDFFLSEDTLPRIIDEYQVELKQLKNDEPPLQYFIDKFPNFTWTEK